MHICQTQTDDRAKCVTIMQLNCNRLPFMRNADCIWMFPQRKKRASQKSGWWMENQRRSGNLEPFIPASNWLHFNGGFKRRSIWLYQNGPSWQPRWALRKHRWVHLRHGLIRSPISTLCFWCEQKLKPSNGDLTGEVFVNHFIIVSVSISGQNLVPKPPLQVQEVVEKRRNPPRATCCFQWISPLHVPANYCLGLSTDSKNEQCQP